MKYDFATLEASKKTKAKYKGGKINKEKIKNKKNDCE